MSGGWPKRGGEKLLRGGSNSKVIPPPSQLLPPKRAATFYFKLKSARQVLPILDPDLQLEPAKGGLFWGQGGLRWHHLGDQKNCIWARLAQQHAGQASLFSLLGSKPGIFQPIWPPQKNHRLASCFLKTPLLHHQGASISL